MKKLGIAIVAVGALIVFVSFGMDTAPEGTHNIGLLQQQIMTMQLGGLATVVGTLLMLAGVILSRLEAAGILPSPEARVAAIVGSSANSDGE